MVWACISTRYKGPLVFIEKDWGQRTEPKKKGKGEKVVKKGGTVNGAIMREKILPFIVKFKQEFEQQFRQGIIFMEDGAGAHRAKLTHEEYQRQGIFRSSHPAQSPDLNPIEPVWQLLKQRVYKRRPKTREQLRQYIQEEWDLITLDEIRVFTQSMDDRVSSVLLARGGHTKY
jgi:transposase